MTKKHYHHHIDEATGEPTIIEIKGEAYSEELDPELHEFNRLTKKVADAVLEDRWAFEEWLNRPNAKRGDDFSERMENAHANLERLTQEYEKMVSGE